MLLKTSRTVLAIVMFATLLLAAPSPVAPAPVAQEPGIMALRYPGWLLTAQAQDAGVASVISDEAGIAAYFQAPSGIDLASARAAFRTVEAETATYLIGSVKVGDYPESEDVHVYVASNGWILAYYLKADPVAKIFDWRAYRATAETSLSTKLENTLMKAATYAGVPYPGCSYYHFQFPNATSLMLAADWVVNATDPFEVSIPGTYVVSERSWSLGTTYDARLNLDGTELKRLSCGTWCTSQGILSVVQLVPDVFHTIEVVGIYNNQYGYAGLSLVYKAP